MPNSYVKIRLYVQIKPKCFIYCYCWWLPKKLYSLESLYNFLSVFKQSPWQSQKTSYFSKNNYTQVRCLLGEFRSLRITEVLNKYLKVKINIYIKEGGLCLCEIPIKPLTKYEKTHPKMEKKTSTNLDLPFAGVFGRSFHTDIVTTCIHTN